MSMMRLAIDYESVDTTKSMQAYKNVIASVERKICLQYLEGHISTRLFYILKEAIMSRRK